MTKLYVTKKFVIFALLGALLLGTVAMSAGAATEKPYEVGYAKVDINPYWHAWMEWSRAEQASTGTTIPNAGTYPYQNFYRSAPGPSAEPSFYRRRG